jgi:hypothetical protein
MGVEVPTGFGQATMCWALSGDPEEQCITFGVVNGIAVNPEDMPGLINNASSSQGLTNAAGMQTNWTYRGCFVDYKTPTGFIRYEAPLSTVGTNAGTGLPSNCALLVRKVTALGGRKYRGRNFWPAAYLYESSVDQRGVIAGATLSSLQTAMDNFLLELIDLEVVPMLLHSGSEDPTNIVSFAVDGTIATQRRRMR